MNRERWVVIFSTGFTALGVLGMTFLPDGRCQYLCHGFQHVDGHAYAYSTIFAGSKPDDGNARNSTLELYEDGKLLGPAHRDVADIAQNGGGRYLYWQGSLKFVLFMSASDNSDPNTNGRKYTVRDPKKFDPYQPR